MPHAAVVMFGQQQSTVSLGSAPANGTGAVTGSSGGNGSVGAPRPGELGIRQRRSWRTWQLITAVIVALCLGMIVGHSWGPSGTGTGAGSGYTPPPPAGSSSQTTTGAGSSSATSAPTTLPSTTTSVAGATTTTSTPSTAPASGTVQVLLPQKQAQGDWTSPVFTVGSGQWSIGWAFQCSPAPASGPAFEVFVMSVGGSPGSTPAVSETGASGQSITTQASTGSQELDVKAPASCVWAVKVTGIG